MIVGNGYDYPLIKKWYEETKPVSVSLLHRVPLEDYEQLAAACDIGLIFLDHRFTIPNFPSRLLAYMQAKLPVLACTDPNTDIGKVIVDGGFGWGCESNAADEFADALKRIIKADLVIAREREYQYLIDHYTVDGAFKTIMHHF